MPRVAFLFPGQGAQAVGMGQAACQSVPAAKRLFDQAADAHPGGMMSVLGLERAQVEAVCQVASGAGTIKVANLLCPGNVAVSGNQVALAEAERLMTEQGARTVRLAVAGAFHTDLMKP